MDKKLEKAFNEQINKEMFSSYLYLSMAAYCEAENFSGFASWFKMQAKEEMTHALKIFDFINDRGSRVILDAIKKPTAVFTSVEDIFKKTFAHEKMVTASINDLYDLASKVDDKAAQIFLSWFVTEQVEEEKTVNDVLAKLKYVGKNPAGVIMLDRTLAVRQ